MACNEEMGWAGRRLGLQERNACEKTEGIDKQRMRGVIA
jgi:hypothetical protein